MDFATEQTKEEEKLDMYYALDVIITDLEFNDREIKKIFPSRGEAHQELQNIEDSLKDGEHISYKDISLFVTCECGMELRCDKFTNTCDCGADYNNCGQRLAPREQWGIETGEDPSDCI